MNDLILVHESYLIDLPDFLKEFLIDRSTWSEDRYYLIHDRDMFAALTLMQQKKPTPKLIDVGIIARSKG